MQGSNVAVTRRPQRRGLLRRSIPVEDLPAIDRLTILAVAATPLALLLDYRLGLSLYSKTMTFRHLAEDGRRLADYQQVFGVTQLVWLCAGARAATRGDTRRGFRSTPAIALLLILVFLLWVTALVSAIDQFALLSLGSTLLPLYAMAGVLCHPSLSSTALQRAITILLSTTAVIVAATALNAVATGTVGSRVGFFPFGSAPDAALPLADMVPLLVVMRRSRTTVLSACGIGLGLLLTQTRGAILAALLGILILVFWEPRLRPAATRIILLVASALVLFSLGTHRPLPFVHDTSSTYRRVYLGRHVDYFLERPVTGWGVSGTSADFFRTAHNTLLGLADAGGLVALFLWVAAWAWPVRVALGTAARERATVTALAVLVATLTVWNTTGSELLVYQPPTNLLPLVLGTALAIGAAKRREMPNASMDTRQRSERSARD